MTRETPNPHTKHCTRNKGGEKNSGVRVHSHAEHQNYRYSQGTKKLPHGLLSTVPAELHQQDT